MAEDILRLEDIWKIYEFGQTSLAVLKGISFSVDKGSFVAIMGPSGSGKSTLLHMIGALDTPTKGKVYIAGKDISRYSEDELAGIRGKNIGFVFQQFNLFPNLTAQENVILPMVFQKSPEKERVKRARELLFSLGLEDRIHHRPAELSGGEKQRIAIARALANDPEIIVADEPTGNLDSETGKKIMEVLRTLNKEEGKTLILVTHDPNIAKLAEKTIHIKDGKIQ
ncbi:MAG: ABC transporter ATP-binding protein [Candidatus Nealsonbacteria bacterium RIFOXYB1_FULL_40_15]|uniref:ABC transporter ATP-binding protein n=2 Tax=Candidatus Nealsoniibacteriota TaxID=1817911 RepID=A0A1G2ERL6_9BACT|nr:MAG: ABC transporter ATP-binding protein [Candidatus Nealsonbacteria bacterium RIFOXYB1_FULL_40_15]OGZ28444.1 MAG: ABC transporter ATP-binding protein [Candidatus Nealsonbacteria bacterium RIFOXYC1_FULL_40_7]